MIGLRAEAKKIRNCSTFPLATQGLLSTSCGFPEDIYPLAILSTRTLCRQNMEILINHWVIPWPFSTALPFPRHALRLRIRERIQNKCLSCFPEWAPVIYNTGCISEGLFFWSEFTTANSDLSTPEFAMETVKTLSYHRNIYFKFRRFFQPCGCRCTSKYVPCHQKCSSVHSRKSQSLISQVKEEINNLDRTPDSEDSINLE